MKPLSEKCPQSSCDGCPDAGCGLLGACGLQLLALLVPPAVVVGVVVLAVARLV